MVYHPEREADYERLCYRELQRRRQNRFLLWQLPQLREDLGCGDMVFAAISDLNLCPHPLSHLNG